MLIEIYELAKVKSSIFSIRPTLTGLLLLVSHLDEHKFEDNVEDILNPPRSLASSRKPIAFYKGEVLIFSIKRKESVKRVIFLKKGEGITYFHTMPFPV